MSTQPSFNTPIEAIEFIRICLQQGDPAVLYTAFTQETGEFWKERLVRNLCEIEATETLERVFLENGNITSFPVHETVLHLGGHHPMTHYIHIKLVKEPSGWALGSIHVCR